jgi:hypothetical protein
MSFTKSAPQRICSQSLDMHSPLQCCVHARATWITLCATGEEKILGVGPIISFPCTGSLSPYDVWLVRMHTVLLES